MISGTLRNEPLNQRKSSSDLEELLYPAKDFESLWLGCRQMQDAVGGDGQVRVDLHLLSRPIVVTVGVAGHGKDVQPVVGAADQGYVQRLACQRAGLGSQVDAQRVLVDEVRVGPQHRALAQHGVHSARQGLVVTVGQIVAAEEHALVRGEHHGVGIGGQGVAVNPQQARQRSHAGCQPALRAVACRTPPGNRHAEAATGRGYLTQLVGAGNLKYHLYAVVLGSRDAVQVAAGRQRIQLLAAVAGLAALGGAPEGAGRAVGARDQHVVVVQHRLNADDAQRVAGSPCCAAGAVERGRQHRGVFCRC